MESESAGDAAHAAAAPAKDTVLVPSSALVARGGSEASVVYVVEGDVARAHAVKVGQAFGELRAVTGLAAGARVVRVPPPGIHDGAKVSVSTAGK